MHWCPSLPVWLNADSAHSRRVLFTNEVTRDETFQP